VPVYISNRFIVSYQFISVQVCFDIYYINYSFMNQCLFVD